MPRPTRRPGRCSPPGGRGPSRSARPAVFFRCPAADRAEHRRRRFQMRTTTRCRGIRPAPRPARRPGSSSLPGPRRPAQRAHGHEAPDAFFDPLTALVHDPGLPGSARPEPISGTPVNKLSVAQIMHGKLQRDQMGLVRDAYDVNYAHRADPSALETAGDSLTPEHIRRAEIVYATSIRADGHRAKLDPRLDRPPRPRPAGLRHARRANHPRLEMDRSRDHGTERPGPGDDHDHRGRLGWQRGRANPYGMRLRRWRFRSSGRHWRRGHTLIA